MSEMYGYPVRLHTVRWLVLVASALQFALVADGRPGRPENQTSITSPQPARSSTGRKEVGICASGALEVYARNAAEGWAKTRCAPAPTNVPSDKNGLALNWRDAAVKKADGLTYVVFLIPGEDAGGQIRFNDAPSYGAVVVGHGGGGGTAWPLKARDGGPEDDTDWQDLQDKHGMRVVEVAWHDAGIKNGGRFTRNSPAGRTLGDMLERPNLLFEWIYDNLNVEGKPFGLIGSSGGADAVLAPQVLQSRIKDKISYLAPVSYPPPFYDPVVACNGPTPPGTFVTAATAALGESGIGVKVGSGKNVVDSVLRTPGQNCAAQTMTKALAGGSSTKDSLDAILARGGSGYKGALHVLIGTATTELRNSDVGNGVVWSSGNLFHHPYFAGARRIWFESATEGHGEPFWNASGPGFSQVHRELVRTLLDPQK